MEVHSTYAEHPQIEVNRSSESIPTCKSLLLHALQVPEGIADVLKIEARTTLLQTRSFATPISKEVTVWTLARFVTVRSAQRFLLSFLGLSTRHNQAQRNPQDMHDFSRRSLHSS